MSVIIWRFRFGILFIVFGLYFVVFVVVFEVDYYKGEESIQIYSYYVFVGREGKNFVFNGELLYINGWNFYWLMIQVVKECMRL